MAAAPIAQTKVCTKCGGEKPFSEYSPHKLGRYGLQSKCRPCSSVAAREWRAKNKAKVSEYNKAYKAANPQNNDAEYKRRWYLKNKDRVKAQTVARAEQIRARQAERRNAKAEHIRKVNAAWQRANKEHLRQRGALRRAKIKVRLENSIREGVRRGLANKGGRSTFFILGYSVQALIGHLERQFENGMTWENYGQWHIDHIQPLSSFKYQSADDAEFRAAWALSNLRPLWATDNLKKGRKRIALL